MKRKSMDILGGSIADKLLIFALPLAFTGMLQQLFNAADVAVVGRFVGKDAMAAVGSNGPVIGLLVNGFMGLALGANVVISRFTGQQNDEGVSRCVHTSVLFSLLGGVALTLIGEAFAPAILRATSVPADVLPMATAYLRVYLVGLPVIFLYNFESAIFRSQGDTRTPLLCLVASGLINVALNLVFVCGAGMAAEGVALATVISNLASSALLFAALCRRDDRVRIEPRKIRIHKDSLSKIFVIGLPAGLQSMVFSLSNICVQSAVNSLGTDVMAASSAAFNIEILAYYLVNSFGQACTTFVGQNYGAGNIKRCRRVVRISLALDVGITLAVSLVILPFGRPLLSVFNRDAAIAAIGMVRLRFILAAEAVNAVMEIMSGAMRGYGSSLTPALITFAGVCGIRVAWVYTVFRAAPRFDALMLVYPVSWVVTAVALVIAYAVYMHKMVDREPVKL